VPNQREFFDEIKKKLDVKNPMDWMNVTVDDILRNGGWGLLSRYGGSLQRALKSIYPDMTWDKTPDANLSWKRKKSEGNLFRVMQGLFPKNSDVHSNYVHPSFTFSESKKAMTFDIFIPSLKLALEHQGEHHYRNTKFAESTPQQAKDAEKKQICEKYGVTFLEIPYWWNGTKASLAATIHKVRPDLIPNAGNGKPIPTEHKRIRRYNYDRASF